MRVAPSRVRAPSCTGLSANRRRATDAPKLLLCIIQELDSSSGLDAVIEL